MRYRTLLSACICASGVVMLDAHKTAAKTYFIEPIALSNGYAIDGGFIETNGTTGHIDATVIVDYEVQVTGSLPVLFRPTESSLGFYVDGVLLASNVSISVPTYTSSGEETWIVLQIDDHSDHFTALSPNCETWQHTLIWNDTAASTTWQYQVVGDPPVPLAPPCYYDVPAQLTLQPPVDLVIATVPEPATLLLALCSLAMIHRFCIARTQ